MTDTTKEIEDLEEIFPIQIEKSLQAPTICLEKDSIEDASTSTLDNPQGKDINQINEIYYIPYNSSANLKKAKSTSALNFSVRKITNLRKSKSRKSLTSCTSSESLNECSETDLTTETKKNSFSKLRNSIRRKKNNNKKEGPVAKNEYSTSCIGKIEKSRSFSCVKGNIDDGGDDTYIFHQGDGSSEATAPQKTATEPELDEKESKNDNLPFWKDFMAKFVC